VVWCFKSQECEVWHLTRATSALPHDLDSNLFGFAGFVTKCIQLYETTVVRHGLMLVGPTCSGKTKCYNVLGKALTQLRGQPSISGGTYEAVHVRTGLTRSGGFKVSDMKTLYNPLRLKS